MRYVNVFCGRYSLGTGARIIAWFYIVLYLVNIILNVTAVDIVKSYKDNVDEDIDYDKYNLLTINYICLTFGVVTILLSTAFLVKFSESEDFVSFMVKWNVIRCFFIFAAIIYVAIEMHHVLTVSLSTVMITVDLCASTYFTGIMASYIKQLEDPSGQVHSDQQRSNGEPSVYLISHKKSLHTKNTVSYVNEVGSAGTFEEIPLSDKKDTETNHNLTTTNNCINSTEKASFDSTTAIEERGDHRQELNTTQRLPAEETTKEKNDSTELCENSAATKCTSQGDNIEPEINASSSDIKRNSDHLKSDQNSENLKNDESAQSEVNATTEHSDIQTESEKQVRHSGNQDNNGTELSGRCNDEEERENHPSAVPAKCNDVEEIENPKVLSENSSDEKEMENATVCSEKSSDKRGKHNLAVDVNETEPPCVVIIPASPEEEVGLRLEINDEGTVNPVFETAEVESSSKL